MAFEQTPALFEQYAAEVLKDDQLLKAAASAGVDVQMLEEEISKKRESSWKAAQQQINDYEASDRKYQDALAEVERAVPPRPSPYLSVAIVAATVLMLYLVLAYRLGWSVPAKWVFEHYLLSGFVVILLITQVQRFRDARYKKASESARSRKRAEIEIGVGEKELEDKKAKIKRAVTEHIKEEVSVFINSQMEPSYACEFQVLAYSGLAELANPRFYVETPQKEEIVNFLNTNPCGSIGVGGPRGVGKTTLLNSLCLDRGTSQNPVLSVFTSAPVEYSPRDFILYLYSSVCRKVLHPDGADEEEDVLRTLMQEEARSAAKPPIKWKPAGPLLMVLGVVLVAIGLLVGAVKLAGKQSHLLTSPSQSEARAQNNNTQPAPSPAPGKPQTSSRLLEYVNELDIKPWPLIQTGTIFGLMGLFVFFLYGWDSPRRRGPGSLRAAVVGALNPRMRRDQNTKTDAPPDSLTENAWKRLEEIRFQQTFSSGWSGALKLPVGVESAINTGISWAKTQLSLPELVDSFRSFLIAVCKRYSKVIICIDELDKLESDDQAYKFLNQIKAVFGVEKCFYLVSVSQNAISSFERRGLPIRDALDSSLDRTVRLDYLDLAGCRKLLARRVIGLPVPFVCLCELMSGGLPRDLLRVCRDLMRMQEAGRGPDLLQATEQLVHRDIREKLYAIEIASQQVRLLPTEVSALLLKVVEMESAKVDAKKLLEASGDMLSAASPERSRGKEKDSEPVEANRLLLVALQQQLGAYLSYCSALLEFVKEQSDGHDWQNAVDHGRVDRLARGRQALEIDPRLSIAKIKEFQKKARETTAGSPPGTS